MTLTLMLPESPEEWFRQLPTRPLADTLLYLATRSA
jgi:hypothetical protein